MSESFINLHRPLQEEMATIAGGKLVVVEFQGAKIPMVDVGHALCSLGEFQPVAATWFGSEDGKPFNVREFCLSFGTPCCVADVAVDMMEGHGLSKEDCYTFEGAYWHIPKTVEEYLSSLSKDDRSDFRQVDGKNKGLFTVEFNSDDTGWKKLRHIYRDTMEHRFKHSAERSDVIAKMADSYIKHLMDEGCDQFITVKHEGEIVAFNMAERVGGVVHDHACVFLPEFRKFQIGRFCINRNVELSIRNGSKIYDIGHIIPSKEGDLSYKRSWTPKSERGKYELWNFAAFNAASLEVVKQKTGDIWPPYYDLDTKQMVRELQNQN